MSTGTPTSTGSGQPRRSAMKADDEGAERTPPTAGISKAVHIAEPVHEPTSPDLQPRKQFTASLGKRLSGRPPLLNNSSRTSLISNGSLDGLETLVNSVSPLQTPEDGAGPRPSSHHRHRLDRASEKLLAQVSDWIQHEKTKMMSRATRKVPRRKSPPKGSEKTDALPLAGRARAPSVDSNSSEVSLDRLQRILEDSMAALGFNTMPHLSPRLGRRSSRRKPHKSVSTASLHRTASSDTEWADGDVMVPSCDGFLDNSKTMSYSGGKADAAAETASISSRRSEKEKRAWIKFKNEIIRLAHTLRLKGWRRVALDSGERISVERLSGALTNAVYVVCPPKDVVQALRDEGKKPPSKVLLRVYGPQVEHLIDRENELSVLRRLAKKKIGPRMLGTFLNGRFEQFFNATTLTPANLREPETSRQIAKRMRELHDGMELLEEEKDEGPAVWKNWDKWLDRVEQTITYLDQRIKSESAGAIRGPGDSWKRRGLICGTEWQTFRATVEKYRAFLNDYYGSPKAIRDKLVFAHNDTQYGNILRVRPDDERSPLLQPANEHKQLVVIDFEYAAANLRGLEFANHFTEWAYNYHDAVAPHVCNAALYPAPAEQRRFVKAYVDHRPQFPHSSTANSGSSSAVGGGGGAAGGMTPNSLTPVGTPLGTPALHTASSSSSIVEFMLDARVPPGGWREQEVLWEEENEARIAELLAETRLWRAANSAMWVAWGIVQAKVPGLKKQKTAAAVAVPAATSGAQNGEEEDGGAPVSGHGVSEEEEEVEDAEADAFDYLGYAQDRALFFWGDCVLMGIVTLEELPEEMRGRIKLVDH